MVKTVEFKKPEAAPEDAAGNGTGAPTPKLLRIIIHTSHGGDDTNVRFFNRLYPEWGPRHIDLPRNEEVVVDSRLLDRFEGKCTWTTKRDEHGRPLRDAKTGDVIKIKKLCYPYTVLGEAQ